MATNDDEKLADCVAAALRDMRCEQELSQRAVALRSNLDPKTVNLIERGKRRPTITTLSAICRALGTSPSKVIAQAEAASSSEGPEKA